LILPLVAAPAAAAPQTPGSQVKPVNPNVEPETILLWPDGAPGALGTADSDRPTITLFRARQPNSTAVIVAPGGGYANLASNHEGRQVANYLNAMGVTTFVLKYRLGPRYNHPIELGDALRAIRLVRSRAAEFGIAPDRIGMLGFSAGGHLTATAGTLFGYAVISSDLALAHSGSFRNLLGENPDRKLLDQLSADLQVTAQTPPTFLFHTNADTSVVPENSIRFYLALRKAKVPAEMHILENGPHGVGLALNDPALSAWPALLTTWLRGRGLLTK
jgi:acetyl esterase/lipase